MQASFSESLRKVNADKLLLIFNDVIKELAAVCILHNQENVLLRLNNLIEAVMGTSYN